MMGERTKTLNFLFFCIAILFSLWFPNPALTTWSITPADRDSVSIEVNVEQDKGLGANVEKGLKVFTELGGVKFTVFKYNNCNNSYVGRVSNKTGKIQLISSKQYDWYVITPDDDVTQRFLPDKLPDIFKKDGLKVIFSGKICKIPENVRLIGTPLILTSIEEVKMNNPDN